MKEKIYRCKICKYGKQNDLSIYECYKFNKQICNTYKKDDPALVYIHRENDCVVFNCNDSCKYFKFKTFIHRLLFSGKI